MNNFTAGWYVIYTKPRHEKKVVEHLTELNIQSFLPCVETLRKWHDRKKYIETPLFPSYVFVYLKGEREYFDSLNNESALYYLRSGKKIAWVPNAVVDEIRIILERYRDVETTTERFLPGKKLLIKDGPFTSFCCEVIEFQGRKKILVRVDLLQRSVLVNLSVDCLMSPNISYEDLSVSKN